MQTTKPPQFALNEILTDVFGRYKSYLIIHSNTIDSVETLNDVGQLLCAFHFQEDRVTCSLLATHSRFDFRQVLLDGLKEFEGRTGMNVEVFEEFAGPIPTTKIHPIRSIVKRSRQFYEDHESLARVVIAVAAIIAFLGALALSTWLSPWRP